MPLKNTQLQDSCDALLNDIYQQVLTLQEGYKSEDETENLGTDDARKPITRTYKRDKYFQLLETHSVIPADGITVAEDVGDKTPTDQTETYTDFGLVLPTKMPMSISVSPYQSPIGCGFELRARVIDAEVEYQKVLNYGNETEREQNWTAIQG